MFEKYFKVDMLRLIGDRVSNVRLTLAKVLRTHFLKTVSSTFVDDPEINQAIRILSKDKSRDVQMLVLGIQTINASQIPDSEITFDKLLIRLNEIEAKMAVDSQSQNVDSSVLNELNSTQLSTQVETESVLKEEAKEEDKEIEQKNVK